ncbi:MAG: zinc ribbon domain-containing protein [bacterium]
MFCTKCGSVTADDAAFCAICGTKTGRIPSMQRPSHSPPSEMQPGYPSRIPTPAATGHAIAKAGGFFHSLRIFLLIVVVISVPTAGVVYFTAPGPTETVRSFCVDANNHDWKKVASYASSDTCEYIEKQRDMACSMLKLATSLTGLINGALPAILENSLGVMGVSVDRLLKMNGRELFAVLLKLSAQIQKSNGGPEQLLNIDIISENITGNTAVVHIKDKQSNEDMTLNLVREYFYWKINFADPNTPVFPLEKMLQDSGLSQPQGATPNTKPR